MAQFTDHSLLPPDLQARIAAGEITSGAYRDLIPSFGDAALADHARVYAGHSDGSGDRENPDVASSYLLHFVVPVLIQRFGGHAPEIDRNADVDFSHPFFRLLTPEQIDEVRERQVRRKAALAGLVALTDQVLADEATRAIRRAPCRCAPHAPVYDATLRHVILPEMIRRLRNRARAAA